MKRAVTLENGAIAEKGKCYGVDKSENQVLKGMANKREKVVFHTKRNYIRGYIGKFPSEIDGF